MLKMKNYGVLGLVFMMLMTSACQEKEVLYRVAEKAWPESFGNHRAVLDIQEDGESVYIDLPWRRHDRDPQKRRLLLIEASTGDTVPNIHRIRVDGEKCEVMAGPVKAGTYHFYYLPFEVQEGYGFYNRGYLSPEQGPEKPWIEKLDMENSSRARLRVFECRTSLDNFYPMEIIPFAAEKAAFLESHPDSFLLFTEDRTHPIRMWNELPLRWLENPKLNLFKGSAQRNEYYVFQVGLYASASDLEDIQVSFSDMEGPGGQILASELITCFNTEGIDTHGRPFRKELEVWEDRVQALWVGIDIPEDIKPGRYHGTIFIGPAMGGKQEVSVELKIDRAVLADRGDGEPWRHSRLRWLNSTAGLSEDPVPPYHAIEQKTNSIYKLSGKQIIFSKRGLPQSILTGDTEILEGPIRFRLLGKQGEIPFDSTEFKNLDLRGGILKSQWKQEAEKISLRGEGTLESDGYLRYTFSLEAREDINLEDIRVEFPFRREIAQYMMGMGLPGCAVPATHSAKWDGPEDAFWIGNTRGGIWVELRGSSYHGPLLNLYRPEPPESWNNGGLGGFSIKKGQNNVLAIVNSGKQSLKAGEHRDFEFALLLTPVKKINTSSQFLDRYYHNSGHPDPEQADLDAGVRIVNLHHANVFNPFINYPFLAVDVMKPFVERNQEKGMKVKIYYTIRELSNHLPELWALRSLQDEIFDYGPGGGYPWLREHLVGAYRPQWYDHADDTRVDASILTAPGDSRWINYYIEGLAWLIEHVGIDGLYMDDVAFDRHILKRIRNVMEASKPGCLIDLHSNTGFSKGPATQYAEYFPYVDKLWFGESFMYDEMSPENWLVEVSGIPFGLMGDMLHGGGNPWLGMVFGMTARLPWSTEGVICNPKAIWKIWDDFGIDRARMSGFWDLHPVVETNRDEVKATAYIHKDRVLISIGNFSDQKQIVSLQIDWEQLDFGSDNVLLSAPAIEKFQEAMETGPNEQLVVEARKGRLLYLEENIREQESGLKE